MEKSMEFSSNSNHSVYFYPDIMTGMRTDNPDFNFENMGYGIEYNIDLSGITDLITNEIDFIDMQFVG